MLVIRCLPKSIPTNKQSSVGQLAEPYLYTKPGIYKYVRHIVVHSANNILDLTCQLLIALTHLWRPYQESAKALFLCIKSSHLVSRSITEKERL